MKPDLKPLWFPQTSNDNLHWGCGDVFKPSSWCFCWSQVLSVVSTLGFWRNLIGCRHRVCPWRLSTCIICCLCTVINRRFARRIAIWICFLRAQLDFKPKQGHNLIFIFDISPNLILNFWYQSQFDFDTNHILILIFDTSIAMKAFKTWPGKVPNWIWHGSQLESLLHAQIEICKLESWDTLALAWFQKKWGECMIKHVSLQQRWIWANTPYC